ncbi:S1 family peptidase [Microvirga thermotolerans]|uniref:Trypsin-like serine protease n=1 Tax=Microvirga thermotolerans TaxID=2651334 RepID=A0A5P9JWR5_9HYPH|nr:serine protease [Microvirga thermotolerans]QFU16561.1 trypsin-like serine protease [Microvirga thermotolerans]
MLPRIIATVCLSLLLSTGAGAQGGDPNFREAERLFLKLDIETRLFFQIALTSAGYWTAVPNVNYSRRLHRAIQEYQTSRGESATGLLTEKQIRDLIDSGATVLKDWRFRSIGHPTRGRLLWVPMGLNLLAERTSAGALVKEPKNRFKLSFNSYDGVDVRTAYGLTLNEMVSSGDNILYKILRDDFFVIAGNQGRYNRYVRYHTDGSGILGFDMSWSTEEPPIYGNRLVTVISGSFWASMTGAPFPRIEPARYPWEAPPVAQTPGPSTSAATAPSAPAPKEERGVSSGTGFFVSDKGHIVSNHHVVDSCTTVMVKAGQSPPRTATVLARDKANDLALLKVEQTPPAVAELRFGLRLGEPVAVFGYPLSDVLARTGNFTLGNVTALAGLGDDARHVQISAPVQQGNSGGPLLDEAGNVVGVVTYKLNALKSAALSGDIPQNVNFAVKVTALSNFLDVNQVSYRTGAAGAALKPADLAEKAQSISVYIECR